MVRSPRSNCNLKVTMLFIWAVMVVAAAEGPRIFKVGDEFGWRVPLQNDTAVYSHWASTNRFHIGDSLCES
ncbi:unnamed protein product [Thlaspi arvense]|uniref:Phytocyanin domain-containing protein n=1 Tax=Thlaspi arvense TaxID=13288 RepID=A0AAU9SPZ6_THLAR|nr:unnamed protein product [Thlaspi arvense]